MAGVDVNESTNIAVGRKKEGRRGARAFKGEGAAGWRPSLSPWNIEKGQATMDVATANCRDIDRERLIDEPSLSTLHFEGSFGNDCC